MPTPLNFREHDPSGYVLTDARGEEVYAEDVLDPEELGDYYDTIGKRWGR